MFHVRQSGLSWLRPHLRAWLVPRYVFGAPEPSVERARAVREGIGVVVAIFVTVTVGGLRARRLTDSLSGFVFGFFVTKALISMAALLAAAGVLLALAPPAARQDLRRDLRRPISSVVGAFGAFVLFAVAVIGYSRLFVAMPLLLKLPGALLLVGLYFGGIAIMYWVTLLGVRYSFRAADGHPVLPAATGVGVAVIGLATALANYAQGTRTSFSLFLNVVCGVGVSAILLALSGWEARREIRRHQLSRSRFVVPPTR